MIITQKVTSLAFSIHDGVSRDDCDLTKSQQYHAVRKLPSPLEYFSYMLHFQGILAGPIVFYRDYIEFIEGYHILKHTPSSNVSINRYDLVGTAEWTNKPSTPPPTSRLFSIFFNFLFSRI